MQANDREVLPLGDVLTLKRGYDLPTDDRAGGDVPIISSSGRTGWHDKPKVQGPGVVTGRYGTLGEVFYVEEPFWPLNTALYVSDFKGNHPRFTHYLLNTIDFEQRNTASSVPGVNRNHLHKIEVPLPPLPVQRRIAEILGAYDDLIENNRRRIEILEEMASRIFREWFVHYRYPGHEDDDRRDSDLGEIPADWEVVTVPEAIEINPRISIPDGEKHYVPMASVRENSMVITCDEMRDQRRGRKFQNGDTLFARITPSLENGKTGFVQFLPSDDDVGIGSGELINLRSKTLCPEFVYQLSRTHRFRQNAIKSMTGGSGRQRVQLECFDDFKFAHPSQELIKRFQNAVRPMFVSVQNLVDRNRVLRETRDLLLPRLVSGEIEVDGVAA